MDNKMNLEQPMYYTVKEVAKMLRYRKADHVYELCRANKIPALKVGRSWLIEAKGLHEYLHRAAYK